MAGVIAAGGDADRMEWGKNMSRQELIKYLRAVSAAEKGVEFCRGAIDTIDTSLNGLQAYEPEKKDYKDYAAPAGRATERTTERNSMTAVIVSLIIPVIVFFYVMKIYAHVALIGIVAGLIGAFILWIPCYFIAGLFFGTANTLHRKKVQKDLFESGNAEYRLAMERYNARIRLNDKIRAMLGERRRRLEAELALIEKRRQSLYDLDIIYPPFRNIMAVTQLLAYLEMGISDSLEGSDGAYAQYMQDVRVGRICGELSSLRSEVRAGFSRFQNAIIGEMQSTRAQFSEFAVAFSTDMNRMISRIDAASHDIQKVADSCADSLASLDSSVKTIAWNHYISECKSVADSFRYYRP